MPTYEYECTACKHTFERFQSITAKPVKTCPSCGRRKARRLIGAGAGIIFKGSGFHQTDYRSEDYKRKAKAESAGGASSSTSSSDSSADKSSKSSKSAKSDDSKAAS